jgi:hypothetical protein
MYTKLLIFGPPAVGKSTLLATLGQEVAQGTIREKWNIVDLEAFWFPGISTDDYKDILSALFGRVIVGAASLSFVDAFRVLAYHPCYLGVVPPPPEWYFIFYLPEKRAYHDRYQHKAKTRGVGTDKHHTWEGASELYDAFLGMYNDYEFYENVIRVHSTDTLSTMIQRHYFNKSPAHRKGDAEE